uniref:S-adenosylmethionine:tRNA ribosyltransferase-isomerase n=1 Tax=Tetraselmis sp. GSL018 TaxID=582737 RepID=A0A061R2E8_9CHLO
MSSLRTMLRRAMSISGNRGFSTKLSDYDFHVPPELIAQTPAEPRDSARLLVVRRSEGTIEHRVFRELPDILSPSHLVVLNNTRVVNCKLSVTCSGSKPATIYLLKGLPGTSWEVSGDEAFEALPAGTRLQVDGTDITGTVLTGASSGTAAVSFESAAATDPNTLRSAIQSAARVPLPPYITATEGEAGYQTVYAREGGSVAAPTAGLHFTDRVLAAMDARGIGRAELTLHVGYGTFGHVSAEDLGGHSMHSEEFDVPVGAAEAVNAHRAAGKTVLAVGTTSTRVLESVTGPDGRVQAGAGATDIFIRPGHRFQTVGALLTNLHMPRLTPVMLVAAFAGYDLTMAAYREAVEQRYRFFSFGDSMLVL